MINFIEQIQKLAENFMSSYENHSETLVEKDLHDSSGFKILYKSIVKGLRNFNSFTKSELLKIYHLPVELTPLFFKYRIVRQSFVLVSPGKYVFFIQSPSDSIDIYGMTRSESSLDSGSNYKIFQLLKLNPVLGNEEVKYKDNTGMQIDAYEIALQVIKWSVS